MCKGYCLFTCFLIFLVLSLGLPAAEIYIANNNNMSRVCDNNRIMDPRVWLRVSGIVYIGCVIFIIIYTVIESFTKSGLASVYGCILGTIYTLFSIAWTIIGGISLWRDNLDCGPERFHDMFWASVIIHFILLCCICGCSIGFTARTNLLG